MLLGYLYNKRSPFPFVVPLSLCPLAVGGAGSGGGGGAGGVAAQCAAHTPVSSVTSMPALLPAEMSNCRAAAH